MVLLAATLLWVAPLGTVESEERVATGRAQVVGAAPTAASSPSMARVRAWPRGTVTWATDVPRRYRWSVRQGIRAWNRQHTGVRFVERHWTRAELFIGVGNTRGAAALATVGYQPRAQDKVVLQRTRLPTWGHKQLFGRIVAHELGHVLGLRHSQESTCSLMQPVVRADCSPPPRDDRFSCRWVGRSVGKVVARRYGGEFRLGPRTCALRS